MSRTLMSCSFLLVIVAMSRPFVSLADDPVVKKHKASIDDCLMRGLKAARKLDGETIVRITVEPTDNALEEMSLLSIIELGTGDLALFQGGADPADDRLVVLEKHNLDTVRDAVDRSKQRIR